MGGFKNIVIMFILFMLEHVSNDLYAGESMPLLPMAARFHPSLQTRKRNPYPAVGIYVNRLCRAVIMSSGCVSTSFVSGLRLPARPAGRFLCRAIPLSTSCCASPHPIKPTTTYFH